MSDTEPRHITGIHHRAGGWGGGGGAVAEDVVHAVAPTGPITGHNHIR